MPTYTHHHQHTLCIKFTYTIRICTNKTCGQRDVPTGGMTELCCGSSSFPFGYWTVYEVCVRVYMHIVSCVHRVMAGQPVTFQRLF